MDTAEVKESSDTDSQKASSEEYRSFVEEPGSREGIEFTQRQDILSLLLLF